MIIFSLIYTSIEMFIALIQTSKKKETPIKKMAVSQHYVFVRIFLFFLIFSLIVGSFYKIGVMKAQNKTEFYVTDESQVVLYMNDEYAIVSKFTIDENNMTINVYEKSKIAIDGLNLNSKKISNVILEKIK